MKQLVRAGKHVRDLAMGTAKQVAEVVQKSSSNKSAPKKARLPADEDMSIWTEKVCKELVIRRESEQESIRLCQEELGLKRQQFEEERKDQELERTKRCKASDAQFQLVGALIKNLDQRYAARYLVKLGGTTAKNPCIFL